MKPVVIAALLCLAPLAMADGMRDPTRPPAVPGRAVHGGRSAPQLNAVITTAGHRIAIFNGRLVHDGALVDGYTIESVLADGVRYRQAGVSRELRMRAAAASIKKPSAEPARASSGAH